MCTFASLPPDLCHRKCIFSLDKTRTGVTHVMIYTNVESVHSLKMLNFMWDVGHSASKHGRERNYEIESLSPIFPKCLPY